MNELYSMQGIMIKDINDILLKYCHQKMEIDELQRKIKEFEVSRSEVRKEFAKKLKEKALKNNIYGGTVDCRDIDEVLLKMEGE